jgi:2'-5' RNA ligase
MIRSFIAIELPASLTALLATVQQELREILGPSARAVKWTRPEGTHLTLQFLGDVPASRLGQIEAGIVRACEKSEGPLMLEVRGIGTFPNLHPPPTRMPRVIWMGLGGKESDLARLHALRQAVVDELRPLGFKPDKEFNPHLTLGRVRDGISPADLQALVEVLAYPDERPVAAGTFPVTAVSLMKSELKPGGAIYTQLAHVALNVER